MNQRISLARSNSGPGFKRLETSYSAQPVERPFTIWFVPMFASDKHKNIITSRDSHSPATLMAVFNTISPEVPPLPPEKAPSLRPITEEQRRRDEQFYEELRRRDAQRYEEQRRRDEQRDEEKRRRHEEDALYYIYIYFRSGWA